MKKPLTMISSKETSNNKKTHNNSSLEIKKKPMKLQFTGKTRGIEIVVENNADSYTRRRIALL